MLQVIQHRKSGELKVEELPAPQLKSGGVLVRNAVSFISAGTERMSVEMSKASMLGKAQAQPQMVKAALENVKREGLFATYEKIQTRLDSYKELGYSSAGVVIESNLPDFKPGDRVACTGGSGSGEFGCHAEIIAVPRNLITRLPENVSFEEASFATIGAIALQGVRQADPRLGEYIAVIGLGLLGIITIQLLKASGCHVIGMDVSDANFELAKKMGCDVCVTSGTDALPVVDSFTKGYGTDAVLITAATKSNEPIELAMEMARRKSKVVVIGAIGMDIPRPPFFEKEIDVRISCSTGPGRFDTLYEDKGIDYPIGYVRWTENRNMEAFIDLIAHGKLDIKSLVTHRFPIQEAPKAYDLITGNVKEYYLGITLTYPERPADISQIKKIILTHGNSKTENNCTVGFIGAGIFAQGFLIPPLQKMGIPLKGVVTAKPVNAISAGKKFGFEYCATSPDEIIQSKDTNTVFIATRHDSHARYVVDALRNGKHVFVEKPLAITEEQLEGIRQVYQEVVQKQRLILAVGFNRRYSTPLRDMKNFFANRLEPFVITYRVNAGILPKSHWVQDNLQGGRIIGEGCHFIDCMQYLTGARPVRVYAACIQSENTKVENSDNVHATITFSDGSIGNLIYLANGDGSVPREYCEASAGGKTAIMNNFKEVSYHASGKTKKKSYDGSMGHKEEIRHVIHAIAGQEELQPDFESVYYTTLTTIRIVESLTTAQALGV